MSGAKIQLSEEELMLAQNSQIILTKNAVMEKAFMLLDALSSRYQHYASQLLQPLLPELHPPKISKGERYLHLPYMILDFPRFFKQEDVLAIRTMFWWGHFWSITLHLKGTYKEQFRDAVHRFYSRQDSNNWMIQISGNEWQHHPAPETHRMLKSIPAGAIEDIYTNISFLKLNYFFPLDKWNEADRLLADKFGNLIDVLADQFPSR